MKWIYNNIGEKIKKLALVLFIILSIWSIIESFLHFENSIYTIHKNGDIIRKAGAFPDIFGTIVVFIVGLGIAFIISLLMYGFGELIENVVAIRQNLDTKVESNIAGENIASELVQDVKTTNKYTDILDNADGVVDINDIEIKTKNNRG